MYVNVHVLTSPVVEVIGKIGTKYILLPLEASFAQNNISKIPSDPYHYFVVSYYPIQLHKSTDCYTRHTPACGCMRF